MNKIHTFAKVALAAIGIFSAVRTIPYLLMPLAIIKGERSLESVGMAITTVCAASLWLVVLFYVFAVKREQLSRKIVGADALPEPDFQIQWLPVAFRLICIAAGLYCLHTVAWRMVSDLGIYFFHKAAPRYAERLLRADQILSWLTMLVVAVYLLCGAPHFVRWHVKKTLQLCKQQPKREDK